MTNKHASLFYITTSQLFKNSTIICFFPKGIHDITCLTCTRDYDNTVLWSFQGRGTKLERFLYKNQHTQRDFLNFENWTTGEPQ